MSKLKQNTSVNQEKQQRINRSLVINLLCRQRRCSRADLAKLSGLKRATITNIVNEFMEYDLILEDGLMEGEKGRRSIAIKINGEKYCTIGVMLTRHYYTLGIMGISGEVFRIETYNVESVMDVEAVLDSIRQNIRKMIDEEKESQVLAVCIAVPGPYKRTKERVVFVTHFPGWEGIEIEQRIQQDFDIPVFIENDANAGACAQHWFCRDDKRSKDIVYIVAGQGIGCGMILNDELQTGRNGNAGEFGHTSIHYEGAKCECGNHGCLEQYCSSIAIMKRIQDRLAKGETSVLNQNSSFADFGEAVRLGDALASDEYRRACEFLAMGIVNLVNQIDPSDIIIGDLLADVDPARMLEIVQNTVKKRINPFFWEDLTIRIDPLEYNPILMGAGIIAVQKILEDPLQYIKKGVKQTEEEG